MAIKVISVEQTRQIEAAADAAGLSYETMMQNAGHAVAHRVLQYLHDKSDARVTVLVGAGNNGGDGIVAGRVIAEQSKYLVRFYLLKPRSDDDPNFAAVKSANLSVALAQEDHDGRVLRNMVASADIVVDALFGIGVKLPLRSDVAKVLRSVNQALNDTQLPEQSEGQLINLSSSVSTHNLSKPYVVAVDCPSGLDCDTGELDANTIYADETITFIAAKRGLLEFSGASAVGGLSVATIGIPDYLPQLRDSKHMIADSQFVSDLLPKRPLNANKGTFGKVLVIAGSLNFVGAAGLTAMSAYRSGTGLVTVAAIPPVLSALSGHFLEPTWLSLPEDSGYIAADALAVLSPELPNYNTLLLGPGWGRSKSTQAFMLNLLGQKLPHLVVDADGLNVLSELDDWWKRLPAETVITPHPGEMGRLAKCSTDEVQSNRWQIAAEKAAQWNVILVLKGAHTLIASPDGRVTALPFKSDALSTAGTGDVLAGLITGFIAQGVNPYDAAVLAGYVHGLAGDIAARDQGNTRSVIAGDVLNNIASAITELSR